MATPNREAIKDVQGRLRAQGLCGSVYVDEWGEEVLCILSPPCESHGEAQQEPEGDGETWTEIYDALFELLGREPTWAESVIAQEAMKATLRARVQPRGLGQEVEDLRRAMESLFPYEDGFTEAFDELEERGLIVPVPADENFREEYDSEVMYVWRWTPLAITPTEGDDHVQRQRFSSGDGLHRADHPRTGLRGRSPDRLADIGPTPTEGDDGE